MKKKISAIICLFLIPALAAGITACGPKLNANATATYGEVGVEIHSYFPYATVSVDKMGVPTAVEIGEAFGPTGKIIAEYQAGTDYAKPVYRNPWYPGLAGIANTAFAAGEVAKKAAYKEAEDAYEGGDTFAPSRAQQNEFNAAALTAARATLGEHYISIAGEIFKLDVRDLVMNNIRAHALCFVDKTAGKKELTDKYLADNIKWYIDAAKEDKVFACNATGVRDTAKMPADGAILKNDINSTYQLTSNNGLHGAAFKKAMEELGTFALDKKFKIEYVDAPAGTTGNWEGLKIKDFTFGTPLPAATAATSATAAEKYLQYAASYMKIAQKAYYMACAQLFKA